MRAPLRVRSCPADPRFVAWALLGTAATLLAFGLVSAIIPNPIFGRSIPPEPFAIAVWIISAPLVGLLLATYLAPFPAPAPTTPVPLAGAAVIGLPSSTGPGPSDERDRGGSLGAVAGFGAFLAIGCPVCNKVALVLLGASGALSVWAPLQPLIGALSVVLLVIAVAWRLRIRRRGGVCTIPLAQG
jgi:hypothetical protein